MIMVRMLRNILFKSDIKRCKKSRKYQECAVNTTCSKLKNTEKELQRKFFKSDIEEQE